MSNINEDVIRLEIPSETPTPTPIKLGMDFFSLNTFSHGHVFSNGAVKFYTPRDQYAAQSGVPGTALIGDLGLTGVTPDGGSAPGDPGTLRAVLVGLFAFLNGRINAGLSPPDVWNAETAYSQNQFSFSDGYIFISSVPGIGTNTGNPPGGPEWGGPYSTIWDIFTYCLNTFAPGG